MSADERAHAPSSDGADGGSRDLVLASAGAGKTFRISSRIIALLDAGATPREILASTFTRKAAGEILERVLARLAEAALSVEAAAALSRQVAEEEVGGGTGGGRERWIMILHILVRGLHRAQVGTLDSFFVRTARSFTPELGLPPAWSVADDPTAERLASEALQDVLAEADPGEVVEMVRMLLRGDAARSVHGRLLDQVGDLREVLRRVDPRAESPWRPFDPGGEKAVDPAGRDDPEELIRALREAELPTTKAGEPDGRFVSAVESGIEQIRTGDWEAFCTGGLAAKVVDGSFRYYRKDLPPPLVDALRRCVSRARESLIEAYHRQGAAMERLARHFDEALGRRQRDEGAYGFSDVTHLLGVARETPGEAGPVAAPVTGREDLWYRLDGGARHLLLDEFQDTSLAQWEAIRPLVERLLAEGRVDATALVVADPKQSIYGWRGARPDLVHHVARQFAMDEETLRLSWRSSPEVLGLVNDVFGGLAESPVWSAHDDEERERVGREVAREWMRDFRPHRAAPPGEDLPGYVRVEAGPETENARWTVQPRMMAYAAERVAALHREAPRASVGVLLRHNEAVARTILELRARGVEASERSGTRLTDSAAVAGVLAALRLADHPSDTVQRYHVARTPVGPLVGLHDDDGDESARRAAAGIRNHLLRDGYGSTLFRWVRGLSEEGALDRRDLGRLLQLVELGYRWDGRATLRPGDFVRYVESERMEDPRAAPVRVMTVHQAKGLEFDAVVLPELDFSLGGRRGAPAVLPERDPETGRVRRIFPYVKGAIRPLVPEVEEASRQDAAARLRDSLGLLYVGLTRARYALHLLVPADDPGEDPSPRCEPGWLLRHALGLEDTARSGAVLLERGDAAWHRDPRIALEHRGGVQGRPDRPARPRPPIRSTGRRSRLLAHRSPSSLEGGGRVDLGRTLHLAGTAERIRGTVAHAWLEQVRWIEDGLPDEERLRSVARREAPALSPDEVGDLLEDFRRWLDAPPVRGALSRRERPAEAVVEPEVPFLHRASDDRLLQGRIDRLVSWRDADGPAAEVVDFKTDRIDPTDEQVRRERVEEYHPQMEAYRAAVAATRGLPPGRVTVRLVFLHAGVVETV